MPENGALHLIVDTDYLDADTLTIIKTICETNHRTHVFAIGNGSGKNNIKIQKFTNGIEGVLFKSTTVDCKPEAADTHIIILIHQLCCQNLKNITLITRDKKLAEMAKRTGEIFDRKINTLTISMNSSGISEAAGRQESALILSSAWQWLLKHPKCGHKVPTTALQKIVQSANLPVNDLNVRIAREAIAYARQKQARFDKIPYNKPSIHQRNESGVPAPLMM